VMPPRLKGWSFLVAVGTRVAARIGQTVGQFNRFNRLTSRCKKTAKSFGSFVALTLSFLIKTFHGDWSFAIDSEYIGS
jgi:hypothetical protein